MFPLARGVSGNYSIGQYVSFSVYAFKFQLLNQAFTGQRVSV
jgi:hypothetical protein